MNSESKGKAYAAAVLYALIISFSFLFVKLALTVSEPMDAIAHRFTVSFVAIGIPVLLGWIKLNIGWREILRILPLSLLYPAMFFSLQVFGLRYSSSSEGGIIQATVPIFTMVLASLFLKERSNGWQKLSVVLSVGGVMYIFLMQGASLEGSHVQGISLLLLSCVSFAGYSVLARPLSRQYKPMDLSFIMLTIGFLFFNGVSLVKHGLEGSMDKFVEPLSSPLFIVSVLYLGIFAALFTTLLLSYAVSTLEASKLSVFGNLSTLISMAAGVVFLDETLHYYHWIGAVMIVAGVLGVNFLDNAGQRTKMSVKTRNKPLSS